MTGSQLNKSFLWARDDHQGWNYTTYFSFFNDFTREDDDMKYVEMAAITLLCTISFILNSALITFFLYSKELRTRQHMFTVSVLFSSIFLLPFSMLIGITRLSDDGWMFGDLVCKSTLFSFLATSFIKIWLMSLISIDRYLTVVHLPDRQLGQRSSILLTIAAWALPVISLAAIVFPNTTSVQVKLPNNTTVGICSAMFRYHPTIKFSLLYFSILFTVEYLLPAIVMTVSYSKIMEKIKNSSQALIRHSKRTPLANDETVKSLKKTSKERRTTVILISILILFLLMWSPLFGLLAWLSLDQWLQTYRMTSRFVIGNLCVLIANTIIEPVLFSLTTGQVRQKIATICKKYRLGRTITVAPLSRAEQTLETVG